MKKLKQLMHFIDNMQPGESLDIEITLQPEHIILIAVILLTILTIALWK